MENETAATEMQRTIANTNGTMHTYIVWGAVLVAAASVGASFFVINNAGANADYICTHIIEENGDCTNGSWGAWATISTSTDTAACAVTKVEQRLYTGTRTVQHILQYLNLRTACDPGYSQAKSGKGKGSSGFHGGSIFTQSTACQIQETRTTRNSGAQCTTTEMASFQADLGPIVNDPPSGGSASGSMGGSAVTSKEQLEQYRISMIAANIYAKPPLIRTGGTSVIKWQGREVTACTVTGENGDTWEGTSGERTSSTLDRATTYTLTCTAFNGQTVTDQATVDIAPTWEEE